MGPNYQDRDSWKYPNGNFAFVGPNYQDRDSWKYPNGNFAFVGPNYQDQDSWRYPNGNFAFVGPNYSDRNTWYYPNRNIYSTNATADADGKMLTNIVEQYFQTRYVEACETYLLPKQIEIMFRLTWIQQQF